MIVTAPTRSLLAAADSRRRRSEPEDRLTEIFREVLLTSPALAAWLVESAFGVTDSEAERCCGYGLYDVETQTVLRGGGRPDMRFPFSGKHRPPGGLFCENKIRAGWTSWQRLGYPSVPQSSRIVVMSPGGDLPPDLPSAESAKFVPLRWTALAREADRIGSLWGGLDWRTEAVRPDAEGQFRVLAEFLWYLEREDVDVSITRPFTESDLGVLPDVNAVVIRWKQFRDLVLAELRRAHRPGQDFEKGWEKRWDPEGRGGEGLACSATLRNGAGWEGAAWPAVKHLLVPTPPKWSWQELILAPQATWMDQDAPLVAIGVGFVGLPDWSDDAGDWNQLRERALEAGAWLGFTNREKIYRVLMARPLAEILPSAGTLDAQAEEAVSWALDALDDMLALVAAG